MGAAIAEKLRKWLGLRHSFGIRRGIWSPTVTLATSLVSTLPPWSTDSHHPPPGIGGVARSHLERWFSAWGKPPGLDLARSGASGLTTREVLNNAGPEDVEAYLDLTLDYGPGVGSERLRAAVADHVGAAAEDVVVTNGAIEALLLACGASVGERTVAAVAVPGYEGLFRAVEAAGGVVQPVRVWVPGRERLDLSPFLGLDLRRYGAVVVNSPHNPTGVRASLGELSALAERCRVAGTTLIVDQVALGTLDPGAPSMLEAVPDASAVVQVGDVSKSFGLGGLRVGWCAVPDPRLRERIVELRDVTSLATSAPSQFLAALALEHRGRLSVAPSARVNLERLQRCLPGSVPADWSAPADGLVAFPCVTRRGSARAFADRLRERFGVAVTPGTFFGHDHHVRVGLGLDPELFEEALRRLVWALHEEGG